ncbi:hypothetical protein C8F04DRAFT_1333117 [Mycena alexandri]|uniref:Uncharacterized protein n=1 Tax=Mycena alexandri TaxID=1745969 RepID=A0AAD6WM11_9AGAR|nr:hypothetical protein C8F04DRAFT_1333117 [Mycena alexandri]
MVRDENLLYREFSLASHRYIKEIKRIGWDQKHVEALTGFFYGIDTDPMCSQEHGDKVVLIYADRYRLDWFNTLGVPGKSFNIRVFHVAAKVEAYVGAKTPTVKHPIAQIDHAL